jgi:nucleoside-diphosphate-sugar epimerase
MTITCVRPANLTGPDKKFGSIDHVNCMYQPARGQSVTFPHADAMRCVIHVEDMAEAFARVLLADKPKHTTYNSGGTTLSLGEIGSSGTRGLAQRGDGWPRHLGKLPDRQPPPCRRVRPAVQTPASVLRKSLTIFVPARVLPPVA